MDERTIAEAVGKSCMNKLVTTKRKELLSKLLHYSKVLSDLTHEVNDYTGKLSNLFNAVCDKILYFILNKMEANNFSVKEVIFEKINSVADLETEFNINSKLYDLSDDEYKLEVEPSKPDNMIDFSGFFKDCYELDTLSLKINLNPKGYTHNKINICTLNIYEY
jgi:hypothetical protein